MPLGSPAGPSARSASGRSGCDPSIFRPRSSAVGWIRALRGGEAGTRHKSRANSRKRAQTTRNDGNLRLLLAFLLLHHGCFSCLLVIDCARVSCYAAGLLEQKMNEDRRGGASKASGASHALKVDGVVKLICVCLKTASPHTPGGRRVQTSPTAQCRQCNQRARGGDEIMRLQVR